MSKKTLSLAPMKILGETDQYTRIKVMVSAYGSPSRKDLGGDWFDKNTDFGDKYVKTVKAYYDHGISDNPYMSPEDQLIGRATFVEDDDLGRWYEFEIDKHNRYHDAIVRLVRKGVMGASTQAYPAGVKRLDNGYVSMWHESEVSLTLTPMNTDTIGTPVLKGLPVAKLANAPKRTLKAVVLKNVDLRVTNEMRVAARRALAWREEFGRGGTAVGVRRANQIINDGVLTPETWIRVYSFFSRHEVDKQAQGFYAGQEGYPSNGRIAWDLWGGDSGFARSTTVRNQLNQGE